MSEKPDESNRNADMAAMTSEFLQVTRKESAGVRKARRNASTDGRKNARPL